MRYSFSLEDRVVTNGEITGYKWVVNNTVISTEESCTYVFPDYGDVKMTLFLNDSAGNTTELYDAFPMLHPLKIMKGTNSESFLKITDPAGRNIIDGTYNKSLQAYYINNISIPTNIQFDATDVRVENY